MNANITFPYRWSKIPAMKIFTKTAGMKAKVPMARARTSGAAALVLASHAFRKARKANPMRTEKMMKAVGKPSLWMIPMYPICIKAVELCHCSIGAQVTKRARSPLPPKGASFTFLQALFASRMRVSKDRSPPVICVDEANRT